MIKSFVISLLLLICSSFAAPAQETGGIKVAIVNLTDPTGTLVFSDGANASRTITDFFDYGGFAMNDLISRFEKKGFEATEVNDAGYLYNHKIYNFFGGLARNIKLFLHKLSSIQHMDYLVVISRKFVPGKEAEPMLLNRQEYGISTLRYQPDLIHVFSFVGYHVFSTKQQKEIKLNRNIDAALLLPLKPAAPLTPEQMKNLPGQYLHEAALILQNAAETRDAQVVNTIEAYIRNEAP